MNWLGDAPLHGGEEAGALGPGPLHAGSPARPCCGRFRRRRAEVELLRPGGRCLSGPGLRVLRKPRAPGCSAAGGSGGAPDRPPLPRARQGHSRTLAPQDAPDSGRESEGPAPRAPRGYFSAKVMRIGRARRSPARPASRHPFILAPNTRGGPGARPPGLMLRARRPSREKIQPAFVEIVGRETSGRGFRSSSAPGWRGGLRRLSPAARRLRAPLRRLQPESGGNDVLPAWSAPRGRAGSRDRRSDRPWRRSTGRENSSRRNRLNRSERDALLRFHVVPEDPPRRGCGSLSRAIAPPRRTPPRSGPCPARQPSLPPATRPQRTSDSYDSGTKIGVPHQAGKQSASLG